jgi:polysaccharide pyruvyl transferase WcaK-like protein
MHEVYTKIGLLDHMGWGNMGDAAIQESFITNIKSRLPNVVLVGFSLYPDDTRKRHNIVSYPIRWSYPGWNGSDITSANVPNLKSRIKTFFKGRPIFYALAKPVHDCFREFAHLARSYRVVRSLDVLVMSGGGQLCDLHPGLPYNVFKFCLLARLSNTPVFFIGVGADLLKHPLNRFFAKWSVRLANYISFRSVESRALIQKLGVKKETHVCPDPAYALDVRHYVISERADMLAAVDAQTLLRPLDCTVDLRQCATIAGSNALIPKVGLNPMGFCDPRRWPRKDNAVYQRYLDKLETFSVWLRTQNYRLEIFTSDIIVDVYAIEDLTGRLLKGKSSEAPSEVVACPRLTLKDLFLQMSSFDFIVTSKFHGVIFSHLLGKPVIALSYLAKIDDLMRAVGHDRYCLDIEHFDVKALMETFKSLVDEKDHLRSLFDKTSATYADALQVHFDSLFGRNDVATTLAERARQTRSGHRVPRLDSAAGSLRQRP